MLLTVFLRIVRHAKLNLVAYKGIGRDRQPIDYSGPVDVVYLNPDPILAAYQKHAKQHRTNNASILRSTTLRSYLIAQDEYMGDFRTTFTLPTDLRDPYNDKPYAIRTSALVFNYRSLVDKYGIDFDISPLQTEIDSANESL